MYQVHIATSVMSPWWPNASGRPPTFPIFRLSPQKTFSLSKSGSCLANLSLPHDSFKRKLGRGWLNHRQRPACQDHLAMDRWLWKVTRLKNNPKNQFFKCKSCYNFFSLCIWFWINHLHINILQLSHFFEEERVLKYCDYIIIKSHMQCHVIHLEAKLM
jgi:hypothetical protein